MRILLVGDFSGRGAFVSDSTNAARAIEEHSGRTPLLVSAFTLDDAMRHIKPHALLRTAMGEQLQLSFGALQDFHPDRLYRGLALFRDIAAQKSRLLAPAPVQTTPREPPANEPAGETHEAAIPSEEPLMPAANDDTMSPIDALLARASQQNRPENAAGSIADELLRRMTGPHILARRDPHTQEQIASLDENAACVMRAVLHAPAFKALEALWRSTAWLLSRLETSGSLTVEILDLDKETLAADLLRAGDDLSRTTFCRLLARDTEALGGRPWSFIVAAFTFGHTPGEIELLTRLSRIAAHVEIPILAQAHTDLLGCTSLAETPEPEDWRTPTPELEKLWTSLRRSEDARWIGLALPRLLLRLPYGRHTDHCALLDFEELPPPVSHEGYLWGNPAFACAWLLAAPFMETGHLRAPGAILDIDSLPLHTYRHAGTAFTVPPAEVELSTRAAERIIEHGIMPFLTRRHSDSVRLADFRSIAERPTPLAGPWT